MKRVQQGDSLVEVMIALSLTAVTALGLTGLQSALARGERMALLRERAALIADSVAEGMRGGADSAAVLSQWRTRAASLLPAGDVAVFDRAAGVHVATVSWHAEEGGQACPEPQAPPRSSCIAVAFAR
ncbi:prepilin-type cleavage/methylation domain-containing protein [Caballeronia sp. LZ035]|uniref:type IV pilus modification PilV family protein n=1 Tax=Caballeronia sp. LZ035 TaxID=3038568 RepID=UPI002861574F|nr:prepilin-type cleavage/methylation domain-containing protein [Caballeronia sp. LZ035]MDR5758042.1 prepilin-type cleavage/methylation domain-containing protein [Caballeronia sp. LZ035]